MKLNKIIALASFILITITATAQITNDELKKYIIVMDSIETLKNQLALTTNNLSKNSKMPPGRFNTLMSIANNDARLAEMKATPEEIAYVKKAAATRDEGTLKFQQAYQSLINGYIGSEVFGRVRNGVKTDTSIRRRYDSLKVKPIRP